MKHGLTVILSQGTANPISNSKEVQNIIKLLNDLFQTILILGSAVAILSIGYCFIRKMSADEQDQRMWKQRIMAIIFAYVGLLLLTGLFGILNQYFK